MDAAKRFADLFREHMAGRDYREVAKGARIHHTTLYAWTRGAEVPADPVKIQAVAREIGLESEPLQELIEMARLAKMQATSERLIAQMVDVVSQDPDSLIYDPDLDDTDLQALMEKADPRDRENILRAARAYLSEIRRRR